MADRSEHERRVGDFARFAQASGAEAAQREWLQLLREAAGTGTEQDLLDLLKLARTSLPQRVDQELLFEAVDLVPRLHVHGAAGSAQHLLKQCLAWTRSLKQSLWPAMLDRLRLACQGLSKQAETEIQDMFLHLLGVDGARVFMAQPGRLVGGHQAAPPGVQVPSESLFMALPKELRQAIFKWIIPEPSAAHYLPSVQRHGAKLMTICSTLKDDVAPQLVKAGRLRRHQWTRADRLPGSPSQAIEDMRQRFIEFMASEPPDGSSQEDRVRWLSARDALRLQLRQLVFVIALLPDVEQARSAMDALLAMAASMRGCADFRGVVGGLGSALCLAYEGRESEDGFHELLKNWCQHVANEEDVFTVDSALDIYFHIRAFAPARCAQLLPRKYLFSGHSGFHSVDIFWSEFDRLSDDQRLERLEELVNAFQRIRTLSWWQLIAKTHQAAQSGNGGLFASTAWWGLAGSSVHAFLAGLNDVWPHDVPLPVLTLFARFPPDMLRWGFQIMLPASREALLRRPPTFGDDGVCLQLPLMCDFCLDVTIPLPTRIECLNLWTQHSPELARQLQTVAWNWQVASGNPLIHHSPYQADGSEQFRQACDEASDALSAAKSVADKLRTLEALLAKACGRRDLLLGLVLAGRCLPKPLDMNFLLGVAGRIPILCMGDPPAFGKLARFLLHSGLVDLPKDGALTVLARLSDASDRYPALLIMALWSDLFVNAYRFPGKDGVVEARLERIHFDLLYRLELQTLNLPASIALAQWKTLLSMYDLPGVSSPAIEQMRKALNACAARVASSEGSLHPA